MSTALTDVFRLDPAHVDLSRIRDGYAETEGDESDGDTTGDGCGPSPPQGPTTGCLIPGSR
ncbi:MULTISPECIES: hypothetical protein [Streptomyces]|uniref:Uncharacterized protein n=1 Tax=Streptomyces tsukubensis (strain DSM 42081 / NBRC 108919 / NRRL 18488 / 9993) TaxID=1114943 RepID=I2N4F9_STRT9|nr:MULTISPECIES: hypothetical protein [Streptomyces]AZK95992.1 hypothetical protein B7R87_20560 [Streptomyces tsukubensis]EIF91906.1 hypothetical protein [Streptomyces tsukubensis NRRL18488]MYS65082.1 hypothetical protein [Streptomyces sp. SID5473]QKM71585.1 hypothetical protein STSU_013220 [Streptomyces tsukubensis NRRL18488]TAI44386.1 hypothetical protein EWI31_13015 [Streptomyces tsukubensis]